jgi:predicted secreted protein
MRTHKISTGNILRDHGWRIVIALACGAVIAIAAGASSKTVTLADKDNGTTVSVNAGDHVVVRLEFSTGTGYEWALVKEDKDVLPMEGASTTEVTPGANPGAPATEVFRFVAERKGDVKLEFQLVRSWEKPPVAAQEWSVTVKVRGRS